MADQFVLILEAGKQKRVQTGDRGVLDGVVSSGAADLSLTAGGSNVTIETGSNLLVNDSVNLAAESDHVVEVLDSTTAGAVGGGLNITIADGAVGTPGVTPVHSGAGGASVYTAGAGGAGTAATVGTSSDGGSGGSITIVGGAGGNGTVGFKGTVYPTVFDEGTNSLDGTMTGMSAANIIDESLRTGWTRYSTNFASNDYFKFGDNYDFDYNEACSFSLWFRTADTSGYLFSKLSTTQGWGLEITAGGNVGLVFQNTGAIGIHVETTAAFNDDAWHHVVVSKDTTALAAGVNIYVDGAPQAVSVVLDNLGTATTVNSVEMTINGRSLGSTGLNNYRCLDVSIWDDELSAGEVTAIYNNGVPLDIRTLSSAGNLTGYWRCGDGEFAFHHTSYNGGNKSAMTLNRVLSGVATTYPDVPDSGHIYTNLTMTNMEVGDIDSDNPGGISTHCLNFGGTDERAVATSTFSGLKLNPLFPMSYSFWIKTTDTVGYVMGTIRNHAVAPGIGVDLTAGKPRLKITPSHSLTLSFTMRADTAINDGAWHHCLVTYYRRDIDDAVYSWYIDGVSVATVLEENAAGNGSPSHGEFGIGGIGPLADAHIPHITAKITECAFWRRSLSAAEVAEVWNGGAPGNLLDLRSSNMWLKGWWRCGSGVLPHGIAVSMLGSSKRSDVPYPPTFSDATTNFDGTTEYVDMGNVLDKTHTDAWSASAWVMQNVGTGTANGPILSKFTGFTGPGYKFYIDGTRGLSLWIGGTGNLATSIGNDYGHGNFANHNWHHVVVTVDGSTNSSGVSFYIDGVQLETTLGPQSDNLSGTSTTATDFYIGRANTDEFPGNIDEVSMWNRVITPAEVAELWGSGEPANIFSTSFVADLDAWWRMGEGGVGTPAIDNANAGSGGALSLLGGSAGDAGSGAGAPTGGAGGDVNVIAGNGTGAFNGGDVIINAGAGAAEGSITLGAVGSSLVFGNTNANPSYTFMGSGATILSNGSLDVPSGTNFKVGTTALTTANFTAANLDTLLDASDANALHKHSTVTVSSLTTTGLADGDMGYVSAANTMTKTDATAAASSEFFGANVGTAGDMVVFGVIESAKFTTAGGSPTNGQAVYLALGTDDGSTGAGKLTATEPVAVSQFSVQVGICLDNSNYAGAKTCKVLLAPTRAIAK